MEIVKQSAILVDSTTNALQRIERAGRTCYQSGEKITAGSAEAFVRMIIRNGHHSVLEHAYASFRIITSRRMTHELVRHRLFTFSQESTRYCKYAKHNTYIYPHWWDESNKTEGGQINQGHWLNVMERNEDDYKDALEGGWSAQDAGELLNNALKAEIVVTGNVRQWRNFLRLRLSPKAHPQMRQLAEGILHVMSAVLGEALFEDIMEDYYTNETI